MSLTVMIRHDSIADIPQLQLMPRRPHTGPRGREKASAGLDARLAGLRGEVRFRRLRCGMKCMAMRARGVQTNAIRLEPLALSGFGLGTHFDEARTPAELASKELCQARVRLWIPPLELPAGFGAQLLVR